MRQGGSEANAPLGVGQQGGQSVILKPALLSSVTSSGSFVWTRRDRATRRPQGARGRSNPLVITHNLTDGGLTPETGPSPGDLPRPRGTERLCLPTALTVLAQHRGAPSCPPRGGSRPPTWESRWGGYCSLKTRAQETELLGKEGSQERKKK